MVPPDGHERFPRNPILVGFPIAAAAEIESQFRICVERVASAS